jgi:hypothetical protein
MIIKKCNCGKEYQKYTSLQTCCIDCLAEKVVKTRVNAVKVAQKHEKRELINKKKATKSRLREMERISAYEKRAHAQFNKWVRLRDKDDPCPSCNRYDHEIQYSPYGKWDCGHYLSVGSHPELRFEPLNAHKQCKKCNGGAGNYSKKERTVSAEYRVNLIKKIGIEKVEWLEGPHEPAKHTRDDLVEIERKYKELLKNVQNA